MFLMNSEGLYTPPENFSTYKLNCYFLKVDKGSSKFREFLMFPGSIEGYHYTARYLTKKCIKLLNHGS